MNTKPSIEQSPKIGRSPRSSLNKSPTSMSKKDLKVLGNQNPNID